MSGWMLYAVAIAAACAASAWGAEQVLRGAGRQSRGVWLLALALSLTLPLAVALRPAPLVEVANPGVPVSTFPEVSGVVPAAATAREIASPRWEARLPWLWAGSSALLALALLGAHLRLQRRRRRWPAVDVDGVAVRLSDDAGPAVVGWWRREIVLPRWLLEWPESRRRLILRHETEHLRSGDPLAFLAGLVALVALPWNPRCGGSCAACGWRSRSTATSGCCAARATSAVTPCCCSTFAGARSPRWPPPSPSTAHSWNGGSAC